jgi:hypothetical protein
LSEECGITVVLAALAINAYGCFQSQPVKHNSLRRIGLGVLIGAGILVGVVLLLTLTLGSSRRNLYAGKPITYWRAQLNGGDMGASNEAFTVLNSRVIPELIDNMIHDTNDSHLRISLVETLNQLPGVNIYFNPADGRRVSAAQNIGELGPAARSAVPALIQAVKGKDAAVHESAIDALGKIHSDPEVVIPLLIGYLDDNSVNDEAARALGNYGSLAKAAVPKIIPWLRGSDKDARVAAAAALEQIDPESYLDATKPPEKVAVTNSPATQASGARASQSK